MPPLQQDHAIKGHLGGEFHFCSLPHPIRRVMDGNGSRIRKIRISKDLKLTPLSGVYRFTGDDLEIVGLKIDTETIDESTVVSFRRSKAPSGTIAEMCVIVSALDKEVVPYVLEVLDTMFDELQAAQRASKKASRKEVPQRRSRELTV